jgi:hypothetical protein
LFFLQLTVQFGVALHQHLGLAILRHRVSFRRCVSGLNIEIVRSDFRLRNALVSTILRGYF